MFAGQIAVSILSPPFCSLLCKHELRAPRDETYSTLLCQQHIGIVQSCTSFFTEAISDSLTKMFPCLEKKRSRLKKGCYFQPSTEMIGVFMTGGTCSLYNIFHHHLRHLTTNYQSRPSAADRSELLIPLEHSDHKCQGKCSALLIEVAIQSFLPWTAYFEGENLVIQERQVHQLNSSFAISLYFMFFSGFLKQQTYSKKQVWTSLLVSTQPMPPVFSSQHSSHFDL